MNKIRNGVIAVLAAALLLALPLFLENYLLTVATTILMTTILAQSWNLISGYTGQFSFGQAAFFGIGAYTSVVLYTSFGLSPWVGIPLGMALSGAVGAAVGYLAFRRKIKGDYFALATLAFAEILRLLAHNSQNTVFNGPSGIFVTFIKGGSIAAFQFYSWRTYYYIVLVLAAIVTAAMLRLGRTRYGLQLVAIRENESAANSLGVNVLRCKLSAIGVSAALAALAGGFYAQYYLFIDPASVFGSSISMQAIIPCIIGGAGTPLGPVLGSLLIVPLQELTNSLFTNVSGVNMIIYGILIVLFVLFCPNGIIGLFRALRRSGHRKEAEEE